MHRFAQIGIVNLAQRFDVTIGNFLKSELDVAMFVFQSTQDLIDERLVLHHEQVGIENSGILRADGVGDLLLHLENLRARLNERGFKARDFVGDMRRLDAITHDVIALDREDMNRAARDSREAGTPWQRFSWWPLSPLIPVLDYPGVKLFFVEARLN